MSYITKSLCENEQVLRKLSHHWTSWIPTGICVFLAVISGLISMVSPQAMFVAVFLCVVVIFEIIKLKTTEIGVTNKRVIIKTGCIQRRTEELRLRSIETVTIQQGIVGRLLNYGKLVLTGTGTSKIVMKKISHPLQAKQLIESSL